MKITHHVSLNVNGKRQRAFRDAGVTLEPGLATFDIDEDDPRWTKVAELITLFDALDITWANFTPHELDVARLSS